MKLTSRLLNRAVGAVVAVAVLAAAAAAWLQFRSADGELGNTSSAAWLSGEKDFGGSFTLVDHHGKTVTEADFSGKFMLIYFGYTFCPDTCPVGLSNIIRAMDLLADKGASITPVFITIDPERDTAEVLAGYVDAFHPRLVGLTGTGQQIAAVAEAYRVFFTKLDVAEYEDSDDYFMGHTNTTYLVGPDGKGLSTFSGASDPETIAVGLKKFLSMPASATLAGSEKPSK